jgi:Zn-dependent protease with chaperone function
MARYYDGISPKEQLLTLHSIGGILYGKDANGEEILAWPFDELSVRDLPINGRDGVLAKEDSEARLYITNEEYEALVPHLPKYRPDHGIMAWLIVGVSTLALIAMIYFGWTKLTPWVADQIPQDYAEELGDDVITILSFGNDACEDSPGKETLKRLTRRLSKAADMETVPRVIVVDGKMENAFAAPGGRVVLFRKIIENSETIDEVVGVLAHEMAHVAHRHPLEGYVRRMGMDVILSSLFGQDGPGTLVSAGRLLQELSYGREAERQADAMAVEIMRKTGYDPKGLGKFFKRLQKKEKGSLMDNEFVGYISTHPATSERLEMLEKLPSTGGLSERVKTAQLERLKRICASKDAKKDNKDDEAE